MNNPPERNFVSTNRGVLIGTFNSPPRGGIVRLYVHPTDDDLVLVTINDNAFIAFEAQRTSFARQLQYGNWNTEL